MVKDQEKLGGTMVVVEIGAGLSVPTIRFASEALVDEKKKGLRKFLIRINPEKCEEMAYPQAKIEQEGDLEKFENGMIELNVKGLEGLMGI